MSALLILLRSDTLDCSGLLQTDGALQHAVRSGTARAQRAQITAFCVVVVAVKAANHTLARRVCSALHCCDRHVYVSLRLSIQRQRQRAYGRFFAGLFGASGGLRSEEHTSELQSLMRNSYAVFCLKKKKDTNHI